MRPEPWPRQVTFRSLPSKEVMVVLGGDYLRAINAYDDELALFERAVTSGYALFAESVRDLAEIELMLARRWGRVVPT